MHALIASDLAGTANGCEHSLCVVVAPPRDVCVFEGSTMGSLQQLFLELAGCIEQKQPHWRLQGVICSGQLPMAVAATHTTAFRELWMYLHRVWIASGQGVVEVEPQHRNNTACVCSLISLLSALGGSPEHS